MKKIAFIGLFFAVFGGLHAQTHTHAYDGRIRTLRVERTYLVLNNGIVDGSESDNTLYISFDEMSHDVHFYTYTVRHMNADFTRASDLLSGEYLQGFTTQDITDYEHSINTSRSYTHYAFRFPNEEMTITKSGNYRLFIYEDNDPDKRVAEVDFCVVEPMVKIEASVRSNTDIEFNGRYQQVDLDINTTALDIRDPNEIRVRVTQNNRLDNAVWLNRPTFIERGHLKYQQNKDLIFEGGNEYRHFDAFSTYFAGTGIDRVYFEGGDYQAPLFADEPTQGQYIFSPDANGRFLINAERTRESDIESEYMWVHWTIPTANPWMDGALYIGGDLFDNEMSLRNRMEYDGKAQCYWLTALVKQGGYDYQYWFVPKSQQPIANSQQPTKTTTQRVDGSYWQTENEYVIYVYWRPFGARYDRLVGMGIKKSTR